MDLTNGELVIWTGGIAATGAILSSVTTGIVTYKITKRSVRASRKVDAKRRVHEKEMASAQKLHEMEMAKVEREQSRKLDAYVAICRYVMDWEHHVDFVVGGLSGVQFGVRQHPAISSSGFGTAEESLLLLVGSREAWEAFSKFVHSVRAFDLSDSMRMSIDQESLDRGVVDQRRKAIDEVEARGDEVRQRGNELTTLMAKELGNDVDWVAESNEEVAEAGD